MSITQEKFKANLQLRLEGLVLLQKAHTVQRLYEKIRLIHNAVGDIYMRRKTISEFQAEHPAVYDKIKAELAPFVVDGYLTENGWRLFEEFMFDPRHDVIIGFILEARRRMRTETAETEVDAF